VAFANAHGVVALRRRFEDADGRGRTGYVGLAQLQEVLEAHVLPATRLGQRPPDALPVMPPGNGLAGTMACGESTHTVAGEECF
jgi:hypothetical protein